MNKYETRKRFVRQTIKDPGKTSEELKNFAKEVKKCNSTGQRVDFLSKLLHVSTRTIWADYMED